VRIIRNTIPAWSSEALFFNVVTAHKKSRYPRAAHTGATICHYGWLKTAVQWESKKSSNSKHWGQAASVVDYAEIDPRTLRRFTGIHPKAIQDWLPPATGLFKASPGHRLTARDRKHRVILALEGWLGWRYQKKHYKLVS
jgi:hypothetical protein